MTTYVSRDYSSAAAGYAGSKFFAPFGYSLAIFLNKMLGYSIVGNWGFNINSTARTFTITASTNTAPPVITTNSPHGLSTGDTVFISGATGQTSINGTSMVSVVSPTQATILNTTSNGTYTASSATLATGFLYATGSQGGGTGASINIAGAASVYAVAIPVSVRAVVAGDVGRMLVLKSTNYPTKNSGIFKISSIDAVNNRYVIDYRSSDTPPPETGTITWWLYEVETQVSNYIINPAVTVNAQINAATNTTPITITTTTTTPNFANGETLTITGGTGNTGVNGTWVITQVSGTNNQFVLNGSVGNGTYTVNSATANVVGYYGDGYNTNNRIILQSPHASGWQTRICYEPNVGGIPWVSTSVGLGGNSFGDFPVGGVTSYIPLFLNAFPSGGYSNTAIGGGNSGTANRYTFVGDDGGQNVFMYCRTLGATSNGLLSMGVPDNEPSPTAPNTDRAYAYASLNNGDFGGIQIRTMQSADNINGNIGNAFHSGLPELVTLTSWSPLEGQHNTFNGIVANSFMYSANAADSPFTSSTEVMPIEVWGGATTDPSFNTPQPSAGAVIYGYNQRLMGTAPFLRNGRTNFGSFALTSDSIVTLTIQSITGNGVSPIQVTTNATNALSTGQTVIIAGVTGNTAANGTFVITVLTNTTFTLNGTTGNGTFSNPSTTIAVGSNGQILPQGTINVISTAGFPTSGTIYVTTSTGVSSVNYTNTSGGNQFTGCTGGTGTMSTGGVVTNSAVTGTSHWLHLQNGIYLLWNGAAGLTP